VNHASQNVEMRIHWAGGVHTELNVRKNKVGRNGSATDQEVVEMVRELAKLQPDSSIAATLNRAGFQTGPGNNWNQTRVKNLRQHHQIPVFVEGCDRPWMTMGEAAAKLGVGVGAIKTMIKQGVLTARQATKGAPWMIERADVTEAEAKNYAHAARSRNAAPENDNNQTLMPII
jgi:excisionase family DNA binding protein